MKRSEVLQNRQEWINFLLEPTTQKAIGVLSRPDGSRCCLGHACHVFSSELDVKPGETLIVYDGNSHVAPPKLVELIGLWGKVGGTKERIDDMPDAKVITDLLSKDNGNPIFDLATLNDETDLTSQQIGEYLQTVIEGGYDTPFKPLSYFPL